MLIRSFSLQLSWQASDTRPKVGQTVFFSSATWLRTDNRLGDRLAIFRVMDMNQTPAPSFFALDQVFDAVRRYG
ncbi:hypothetical protein HDF14_004142 [Edaphobacter lichenicola]|uniref:Uncharacterized protein n=1 Tax=Tunturiibacter gelidiferens TaxID=3069689 RepID=A0A9X0QHA9_9BACT|nr:hypothetical protein [Edaphobacter lichenicola]